VPTEHMFFEGDRIYAVREMIVAESVERGSSAGEAAAVPARDFAGIFKELAGGRRRSGCWTRRCMSSATRRHDGARDGGKNRREAELISRRVAELHEFNPMLGFRGCRLA